MPLAGAFEQGQQPPGLGTYGEGQPDKRLAAIQARLESTWSGRNAHIEAMRAMRYQETGVKTPAALKAYVVLAPLAYMLIERIVGTLTTDEPRISVPPASEAVGALEQSSNLERAYGALLRQIAMQQGDDPIARFLESMIECGHGAMRILHSPQLWRGYPHKGKALEDEDDLKHSERYNRETETWKRGKPVPITMTWLDPVTVYPTWDALGLSSVLEVDTRCVSELLPLSGKWKVDREKPDIEFLSRMDDDGDIEVTFQQLWTRQELIYAVTRPSTTWGGHLTSTRWALVPRRASQSTAAWVCASRCGTWGHTWIRFSPRGRRW